LLLSSVRSLHHNTFWNRMEVKCPSALLVLVIVPFLHFVWYVSVEVCSLPSELKEGGRNGIREREKREASIMYTRYLKLHVTR